MAVIEIGKPFSYYEGDQVRLGLDLLTYNDMKLIQFEVGDRKYPVLTSPVNMCPGSTALKDAYVAYWTGKANDAVLENHLAAVSKVSTLRFRPVSLTDSSKCIVDISDGLIDRPARGMVIEEALGAKVLSLFKDFGTFTNAEIVAALSKRGINTTLYTGFQGQPNTMPTESGGLAMHPNDLSSQYAYYIPPSFFNDMVFGTAYGPGSVSGSSSTMFNPWFARVCPDEYAAIRSIIVTNTHGGNTELIQWSRGDMIRSTMDMIIASYPKLGEFKALLANKLGLSGADLVWDSPDGYAGNLALIINTQKYTACKSLALGPVSFEMLIDDQVASPVEWKFYSSETVNTGKSLKCEAIYGMYNLDVAVARVPSSDRTTELKTFVAEHPGSAVVYSYTGKRWNESSVGPLEQTQLYKDAMEASFDLYSSILWGTTTFKSASNIAKSRTDSSNPILSIRTSVFPQIDGAIKINDYGRTSWNFSNSGIVTGNYAGETVVLNATLLDHKDDVEAAMVLGVTKVYQTTEAEFCQLWYGVSSPSQISSSSGYLVGVSYDLYDLDPNVLSPDGTTSRWSLTEDQYLRLLFIHSNTTTPDLTSLVEGALAMHFIV